jgi:3-phenylpropionate/trans-cinnamate dioxygenase ferredoxin reductase subunit
VVTPSRVVVVGAGHAGFNACVFLRATGFDGQLTLIDGDSAHPYQRPPLSKAFLAGKQEIDETEFRPRAFFAEHQIDLILGHPVVSIDRVGRLVQLDGHPALTYDHLVLATSARPRELPIPGMDLDGVFALHVARHAIALRERIAGASRVAILGGGFIGLETASMAAGAGKDVVVFEAGSRLMARAVSAPISEYFEGVHRDMGVEVRLSSTVTGLSADGAGIAVNCPSDADPTADVVIVGVGVVPNDALASAAGLAVDNGVLVDESLRTTDPRIFAIGDCARFPLLRKSTGAGLRLESVQNATDHARHVAAQICGEAPTPYDTVPWFWTEQHGKKLQIAGLTGGYDRTETVAVTAHKFSVYCYAGDELLGCESVNSAKDHLLARKSLAAARSTGQHHSVLTP